MQIIDYTVVPDGLQYADLSLNAFLFENNVKNISIEKFLNQKYNTVNYHEKEFDIVIEGDKYRLILYDHSEFEKYFNTANYAEVSLEPDSSLSIQRKFIAFSLITAKGEDCLAKNSLFQNVAITYLKNLKEDYLSYGEINK